MTAPDSLLYQVYLQQVTYLNTGANFNRWAQCIRNLLNELGFSYVWDFQSISKLQLDMVIQTVYNQYCHVWYSELAQSNRLDTFKAVNKVFNFECQVSLLSMACIFKPAKLLIA